MKAGDLERVYRAGSREVREILLSVDPLDFDGAKAERVKYRCRRIVDYMSAFSVKWARAIAENAYTAAADKTKKALARFGKKQAVRPKPGTPGNKRVAEVTERALLRAMGSIMETVEQYCAAVIEAGRIIREAPAKEVQEFSAADIGDELDELGRQALRKELSRGALQRQIADLIRDNIVDGKFIIINDRTYNLSRYAKMVARTVIRDAQTTATLNLCVQYDNDLVEVSSHGTDCEICMPYEGNIYSISGTHATYEKLPDGGPPWHPNCKHSLLPTSEEALTVRARWGQA
ncbi:MAG: phage minor capsid protein [Candidatus Omnitrophota bacterium]|jgi:hypothetical protein|nr:phage minor capsid protein [Sphaerochaeta sp.]